MKFCDRLDVLMHHIGSDRYEVEEGLIKQDIDAIGEDINAIEDKEKNKVRNKINKFFRLKYSEEPQGIHEKTKQKLSSYFQVVADQNGRSFDPKWLNESCLLEDVDELKNSINACVPDSLFSVFHFYRNYAKLDETLRSYVGSICRDYCIYRFHSKGQLVCDVLRIDEYENGTAKCRVYIHSEEKSPKYTIYHGNMFIDKKVALYLIASKASPHSVFCPEFIFFTFSGDDAAENYGVISGISDDKKNPISTCVLLTSLCERELNPEKEVRKIKENDSRVKKTDKYSKLSGHVAPILNCQGVNLTLFD